MTTENEIEISTWVRTRHEVDRIPQRLTGFVYADLVHQSHLSSMPSPVTSATSLATLASAPRIASRMNRTSGQATSSSSIDQFSANKSLKLLNNSKFESVHMAFNTRKGDLANPNVRKAISLSIDSQAPPPKA